MKHPIRVFSLIDFRAAGKWILLGALIGVASGLGAVVFHFLLERVTGYLIHQSANYYPPTAGGEGVEAPPGAGPPIRWILFVLPILGGLVSGYLVFRFAPEAEGHGTDALLRSFHRLRGRVRKRVPVVKSIASIVTIGSGGSAGREGPIAQIGAGIGSTLGSWLRFSSRDLRLMALAGAAGGIGAIFRAPLGAALFTTEVLYRDADLESEALIPSIISSIVAYSVFVSFYPDIHALFLLPDIAFNRPIELVFYALMGVFLAGMGFIYVRVFYGARDRLFNKIPLPNHLKPALGGLLLACLILVLPQVLAQGYGWVQNAIDGKLSIATMFVLAFGKILATSFTISSGGSGGVFGPSIFIGAMFGGAYGFLMHQWFPGIIQQPAAFVLVGMAGFFSGVAKVPIAALIMVCEMTGGYELIVPLMLVCVISFLFSKNWTLYEEQVPSVFDSPAHLGDFVKDVLAEMTVGQILDPEETVETIHESSNLQEVLERISESETETFPVVDHAGHLKGILSIHHVKSVFKETGANELIIAKDIATENVMTITPGDDLNRALRAFTLRNVDHIPVVDSEDRGKVIAMLSQKKLISAYDDRIQSLKSDSG